MSLWSVVGLGFIFERHAKAIQGTGDKLRALCDIKPTSNPIAHSFEELLESEGFEKSDCVAVLTPNDLHVPMALECIKRGKKVLVEKPLGISSEEVEKLPNDGSVLTVHQLRYHPELKKRAGMKAKKVELDIAVPRGNDYWDGWKGDTKRSGGILLNIGIHYLDMLIYLFGNEYAASPVFKGKDMAKGEIQFKDGPLVSYLIRIIPDGFPGKRDITIDGERIELSNSENLSYEDLHKHVYEDFQKGIGILPEEALKAIKLAEAL